MAVLIFLQAIPVWALNIVHIENLFDISGDFKEPSDVAVSKDGFIYVVDGVNSKIKIFRPDGTIFSSFGESGNGNGQFSNPLGRRKLAVSGDFTPL